MIEFEVIRSALDKIQAISPALNNDDYLNIRHLLRIVRCNLEVIERTAY